MMLCLTFYMNVYISLKVVRPEDSKNYLKQRKFDIYSLAAVLSTLFLLLIFKIKRTFDYLLKLIKFFIYSTLFFISM